MSPKNEDMPAISSGAQAVSAGGGKAVLRFDCTSGGAQFCQGCYTMTSDSEGEYVRHEDYAKLEQQRAALVEALKSMRTASTIEEAMIAEQKSDAALRAAGEEL